MQSFIKRLFECKGTETLEEVMHLKLFGSDFWFIQSVQSAVGCTPLNKQSLSLSGEAPGTQLWCSPQSALTEEKQLPPSAEGLHQKPPRGAVRGRSESGQCLWRHLGSAPALTCSAHSAMIHLHATAPLPLAALPTETFSRIQRSLTPCIANIFRNDPVAAVNYKRNKCTLI